MERLPNIDYRRYDFDDDDGWSASPPTAWPLTPFEQSLLETLIKILEEKHAPACALPVMLRRLHYEVERRAKAKAKTMQLELGFPTKEMTDHFMDVCYDDMRQSAQQHGFEDVGEFMAFMALMGCARISRGDEDENGER